MSATEFRKRYGDAVLDLLWRQWTQLGIAGQMAAGNRSYVLDPEALLVFSSWFCRYDQRLYDLVIDWLRSNGDFISIPRLRAIMGQAHGGDGASLGLMISCIGAGKERRWVKLADDLLPKQTVLPEPLFSGMDGRPVDFHRTNDPVAGQYGFIRNLYVPSGKAVAFSSECEAAFLLQLRGAFGLSARAETILALLAQETGKIQDIADISCFSWKSIQDVLAELTASGLVATRDGEKRGRYYFLTSPQKILALFGKRAVIFPDWPRIFNVLAIIWKTVTKPKLAAVSAQTFSGEIKLMFAEQIKESLLHARVAELQFLHEHDISRLPDLLAEI